MSDKNYIDEEKISMKWLILSTGHWIRSIVKMWKVILIGSLAFGGIYFIYQTFKKINYTAQTTFVLEAVGSAGVDGQLSSIASIAGVNLGALSEGSTVFQIDNIIELYRSYRMLRSTLLTEVDFEDGRKRLITRYGEQNQLLSKWKDLSIDFQVNEDQLTVRHDSVMKEVVEDILELNLAVEKPNRKLTILSVSYTSKDETFAKYFNEVLVDKVNTFYKLTKTEKTGKNLSILAHQTDSVKQILDSTFLALAQLQEENNNYNSARLTARVPLQKLQIQAQTAGVVYQEMVKNLEIAKISHRNNQPLIQIIDYPIYPLKNDQMKWYKALVYGLIFGGIFSTIVIIFRNFYQTIMSEEE